MSTPISGLPDPPVGTGSLSAGDDYLRALANSLDGKLTPPSQGLYSAIPAPGKLGRTYYATNLGVVFFDAVATWIALNEPIGSITWWAGSGDPSGGTHLEANGRLISRATYPLYTSIIGTTYGAGDGSTTIGIPDLVGRTAVGRDTNGTRIPNSPRAAGQSGGEERHTQLPAEAALRDHAHAASVGGWLSAVENLTGQPSFAALVGSTRTGIFPTYQTGGSGAANGAPMNVMQPYLVLTPIVRVA